MTSDDFTPKEMIDWLRKEQDLRVCLSHDIRMCRVRPSPRELFAADQIEQLLARIAELKAALRDAYEVYAGSDGFIPETAAEGYQQQLINQMVGIIGAALAKENTDLRAARAALGEKE